LCEVRKNAAPGVSPRGAFVADVRTRRLVVLNHQICATLPD
jgi:hypothetical protein